MKNTKLNRVINVIFVVLLLAALFHPNSAAVSLVVGVVWLLNIVVAALSGLAVLVLISEGDVRQKLKKALSKFFVPGELPLISKVFGWVVKLLIVMSLAFSGWIITLVCYALAVVVFNLLRAQLTEQATA
ncbi:DNZ54_00345 family protein [Pantoea sp. UBA6567]|uniref:DNZ54_00345 family protein n=1 Tax=Pantoea sp. UBA6567 TaxID=1947043 RepID=UPI00259296E8|nr:DNZ54_00345 family protein [Pantoea sp. UBA6567]